jgi:SRSO17 transposase
MLPECRTEGDLISVPQFSIEKDNIKGFIEELRGFHQEFRDCFYRSEPREHFFNYMAGQLSEMERKSIEPIAVKVEGGKVRPMQRAISEVVWDEEKMLGKYHGMVAEQMGDPEGVLIFDESGFVKKGKDSAGVYRQYCGTVGKVENCQVGVFGAYASRHGYTLLDKRLFLPEKWFTEEYAERRGKCEIPEGIEFRKKPQLAAEMFQEFNKKDLVPFKYIVSDTVYGNSPEFIEVVDNCTGKIYFVSIPSDTLCWLKSPIVIKKEYKYKGKKCIKKIVKNTDQKPMSVATLAKNINNFFWYRRTVSEGTKGPIAYEFTKRQVIISKNGLPWKSVWLIIKRTLDHSEYSYYISNAPSSTRLKTFVWLSGMRWAIEQCFGEAKTELGMDQYEVRKYAGWNHHILSCMLAHFFLWHLKIRLKKKHPLLQSHSLESY